MTIWEYATMSYTYEDYADFKFKNAYEVIFPDGQFKFYKPKNPNSVEYRKMLCSAINELATKGWELLLVYHNNWYFRRPKQITAQPKE